MFPINDGFPDFVLRMSKTMRGVEKFMKKAGCNAAGFYTFNDAS
jgi:hypothetical protein